MIKQGGDEVAQLGLVEFAKPDALVKAGQTYFQAPPGIVPNPKASNTQVQQGQTEDSNAGPAEGAVRLVTVMRQFEMLQKAVALGTEMNREAIEQVAKVNG
jgi:flagellar basal body rod protein FlgG